MPVAVAVEIENLGLVDQEESAEAEMVQAPATGQAEDKTLVVVLVRQVLAAVGKIWSVVTGLKHLSPGRQLFLQAAVAVMLVEMVQRRWVLMAVLVVVATAQVVMPLPQRQVRSTRAAVAAVAATLSAVAATAGLASSS